MTRATKTMNGVGSNGTTAKDNNGDLVAEMDDEAREEGVREAVAVMNCSRRMRFVKFYRELQDWLENRALAGELP